MQKNETIIADSRELVEVKFPYSKTKISNIAVKTRKVKKITTVLSHVKTWCIIAVKCLAGGKRK